jgi:hypothetical protein
MTFDVSPGHCHESLRFEHLMRGARTIDGTTFDRA